MACRHRWCWRPTVGLSVWCRKHTDLILIGKYTTDRDDPKVLVPND